MNSTSSRNNFFLADGHADQVPKNSENFSQKTDSYSATHSSLLYLFTYYFKSWTQKLLREKDVLRFYLPSFLIVLLICNPPFYIFLFFYCLTLHIIKLIRKRRNLKPWFQDLNCFKDKKRGYRICKFYKNNFTSEY